MKFDKNSLLLYAVADRLGKTASDLYARTEAALKGGATFVQLREKELDGEALLSEAAELKKICRRYGVPFVVNDSAETAIRINADGVHVGQNDMKADRVRELIGKDKILGVSVQNVRQAVEAQSRGADYLGVGAVFGTSSKADADYVGMDTLREICGAVDIPVVAIGGIGKANVLKLNDSGICGIAVISAIFSAENAEKAAEELKILAGKAVAYDCRNDF